MDNKATSALATTVVWIPMLDSDERSAAGEASERFRDAPVEQFWDGEQKLGKEVGRSLGVPDWAAWDIYLFYPPGAEWTGAGLPAPEAALAQAGSVVVGTKGTLPASGDPSRMPANLRGHAEVVGEQANLEALLTQVAEPFMKRHPRAAAP